MKHRLNLRLLGVLLGTIAMLTLIAPAQAADKPNILVIMTDDVGMWNISAYHPDQHREQDLR